MSKKYLSMWVVLTSRRFLEFEKRGFLNRTLGPPISESCFRLENFPPPTFSDYGRMRWIEVGGVSTSLNFSSCTDAAKAIATARLQRLTELGKGDASLL